MRTHTFCEGAETERMHSIEELSSDNGMMHQLNIR